MFSRAITAGALLVATLTTGTGGTGGPGRAGAGGDSGPGVRAAAPTSSMTAAVPRVTLGKTLATGLDVPWGVSFLADGSALVSQRPGTIVRITARGRTRTVGTLAGVNANGEGGLLGLALKPGARPTKAHPVVLYAYLTSTRGDNRVVRVRYDGTSLGPAKAVLTGIPSAGNHNGGEITFGPDGKLWIGTGDGAVPSHAQDRASLGGKILRINPDGSVPADNPFGASPVYSLGHRNVQGIAFDSRGRPWASEFGQDTWDELNRILPGRNYGWPVIEGRKKRAGYVSPKIQWHTGNASPSGLAIAGDVAYLGALRGERLWAVPLRGKSVGTAKSLFRDRFGRIRNVAATPGGEHLWVTTSNTDGRGSPSARDDRVLRLDLG